MKSLNAILEEAIEVFNYPEEMGEDVHESVECLEDLSLKVPDKSNYKEIMNWLVEELSKGYEYEAGGKGSEYTLVRLSSSESEYPGIEAFNFKKKIWIKIEF